MKVLLKMSIFIYNNVVRIFFIYFHSRVCKGFSSQQTMQVCGCVDTFTDLLRLFLQAVNVPLHRQLIHTGIL